ncbi:MAG TPA: radical SAM protein [Acidobacteriota bacterium]|nr:radical SAM protein [Acidobacteriota bacterium]
MRVYSPQEILMEEAVADTSIASNVLRNLPGVPVRLVPDVDSLVEESRRFQPSIAQAKRQLLLCRHQGRFFKPCPAGTTRAGHSNVCCNYFVVNYASNCHMECSYCYLQSYLNLPQMVVYANHQDLLDELDQVFSASPASQFRVGTGELADSLALDPLTEYSRPLVEFFARRRNAVLEFKTKSDCVDLLMDLDHGGRTIVSWSINPRTVQEAEEHKTASIEERLSAAERCVEAGYPVVFHIDPIVRIADWEKHYRGLVQEIFQRIPGDSIPYISLGALRMAPHLKEIMRERFPHSSLPLGELMPTSDGKLRYFKPLRVEMLSKVRSWIEAASPSTRTYTCMENADVWSRVFDSDAIPSEVEVGDRLLQLSL